MKFNYIILVLILFMGIFKLQAQNDNIRFTVSGLIFSDQNDKKEVLSSANVVAYVNDSIIIGAVTSDNNGAFELELNLKPEKVVISYIGYEPLKIDSLIRIKGNRINLGECYLLPNNTIKEIVVYSSTRKYKLGGEEHLITNKMRKNAANSLDLLDQIPGLRYDKISNEIKILGKSSLLFLVNNLEQSKDYILNLSSGRISKVIIDKSPRGKYQSEGYDAIINIILKDEYLGYDINLQNFAIANLGNNNSKDWLMSDQPSINLVYTNNKINAFANYTYGLSNWNMLVNKKVRYNNQVTVNSNIIKSNKPNDIYDYQGNVVNAGMNYKINSKNIISFQSDYAYSKIHTSNLFDNVVVNHNEDKEYNTVNLISNKNKSDSYTATLFYTGEINHKLKIYGDLSYNYYSNNVLNSFLNINNITSSDYIEKRNLFKLNTDIRYKYSDRLAYNFGYIFNFRNYKSLLSKSINSLNYKELRHRIFAHAQCKITDKLELELGTGLEYIQISNIVNSKRYWKLLPYAIANYNINQNINSKISYITDMEYPSLYQLNPTKTIIDTLLIQVGNPNLRNTVNHNIAIDLNLWNKLIFTSSFLFSPKKIGEFIEKTNDKDFVSTFKNTKIKQYGLQLTYEEPFGKYFSLSNSIMYYHSRIKYGNTENLVNNVMFNSEISYINSKHSLMMQLGYYRSMEKNIKLQGYQMYNFDSWVLTANKTLFNNKLNIMLSYFLPLKWGLRNNQKKQIDSPYYRENYNINLKNYRNTLIFRMSYRFNSGKAKFSKKKSVIKDEERINRTFDF